MTDPPKSRDASHTRLSGTQHKAISAYVSVFGAIPNDIQADLIIGAVGENAEDLEKYEATLKDWKAHKWRADNVPGQIDKFRAWGVPQPQQQTLRGGRPLKGIEASKATIAALANNPEYQ